VTMFNKFHKPYKYACKQFISGDSTQI
jgi:hypothetical protein